MTIRQDFFSYVTGIAAISSIIQTRLYWQQLPENPTYPCGAYFIVDMPQNSTHGGNANVSSPRIQIDWYSNSDTGVEALAKAANDNLNGFKSGVLSGFKMNELDAFEESPNLWRITQDYKVHYAG